MQTTPDQWRPSFVLTYAPLLASQAYSDACQLQAEGRAESGPAVLDALRPLGVTDFDMPASAARVWSAIQAAKK
jgi:hypothetical protein